MKQELIKSLQEYVSRTKRILDLSSPSIEGIEDAESYREVLLRNFDEIKTLADLNNEVMNDYLKKIANKDNEFTAEDIEIMRQFGSLLADTTAMECLDLAVIQIQTEKILEAAEKSGDLKAKILAYDEAVASAYMILNMTIRLYPQNDYCFRTRDKGLEAGYHLLEYLDKDKFASLPDEECKELVLIDSRYIRGLFEWGDKENKEEMNEHDLEIMRRSLSLIDDPFYHEEAPNYDWVRHQFRALQYVADFTEYGNSHKFNLKQLKEIYDYTKQLETFIQEHPELEEACPRIEQQFYLLRNGYFAEEMPKEEYIDGLMQLLEELNTKKNEQDFSARNMFINFVIPFEYILAIKDEDITEEQYAIVTQIYEYLASYIYRMPKSGTLSFMLTFLIQILKNFIEVPGGMKINDLCMKLIAAIHPITYVHSVSVANITAHLTKNLIERQPELYIGILGTNNEEEVKAKKDEIIDFAYHGALLHDIGKIFITETIITYGRKLLPEELEMIRIHPSVGADLLELYETTAPYANGARGHHKWYNNQGGYPEDFDLDKSENKILTCTLAVADCLDAATDIVGRNYKEGKSLSTFVDELVADSGVRYAPYIVDLIRNNDDVYDGLIELITEGRAENYRDIYHILEEFQIRLNS